jgi:HAD superfamily hydrolase (TIGR01662 family)
VKSAFLFDLDGTLVDTSAIEPYRRPGGWKEAVRRLRQTSMYPGVSETLAQIKASGAAIAVVTTSVSFYAEAVLKHHHLPYDTLVAYHDAQPTKPAPGCYLLALKRLNVSADVAIGIGDDAVDAIALKAAGVMSAGAAWNAAYHADAEWDAIAASPSDVLSM